MDNFYISEPFQLFKKILDSGYLNPESVLPLCHIICRLTLIRGSQRSFLKEIFLVCIFYVFVLKMSLLSSLRHIQGAFSLYGFTTHNDGINVLCLKSSLLPTVHNLRGRRNYSR
jgi:hypothetical protein